jgi:DNA-repair protein XRCC1
MEARISSNPNRVRMFATDKLSKPVAEQKWDRIKVVCTQPFNRHIQYGVAFVTFHSVAADDEPASSSKLGRFVVKNENDELNSFSAGSLFARRKDTEILSPKGEVLQVEMYMW